MFGNRYFPERYFPDRFFPVGETAEEVASPANSYAAARSAAAQLGLTPLRLNALTGNPAVEVPTVTRTQMEANRIKNPAGPPFDYTLQPRE